MDRRNSLNKKKEILIGRNIIKSDTLENIAFQMSQPHGLCFNFVGHCTLQCTYCPQSFKKTPKEYLDIGIVSRIIDETCKIPTYFQFGARGDNLLHPQCSEIFAAIKRRNFKHYLTLNTNGILMKRDLGKGVVQSGIDQITFSLQSIEPKIYMKLTNNKNIEAIIENIKTTIELRDRYNKNMLICVQFLNTEENRPYYNQFQSFWSQYDVYTYRQALHSWGDKFKPLQKEVIDRYPCLYLWLYPVITHNGNVCSCFVDFFEEHVYGNLKDASLPDIWQNSDKRKEMAKLHLNGEWNRLPLCQYCDGWTFYENIFIKNGNKFTI